MSTVQEIEAAIEKLPLDQKYEIHRWLEEKFGPACPPPGHFEDAYENMPEERLKFEEKMSRIPQRPDR